MNVIETRELSRTFGRRAAMVSLDLEVRAGEIYGFLGPNGAGKTTTIRMLTGILPPSGGAARIVGYDIRTDPGAVRARSGLLPESTGYYGWMTPVDYLGFFAARALLLMLGAVLFMVPPSPCWNGSKIIAIPGHWVR